MASGWNSDVQLEERLQTPQKLSRSIICDQFVTSALVSHQMRRSDNMPQQTNLEAATEIASRFSSPAQQSTRPTAPPSGAVACLRSHWPEYAMEASLLGAFMVSACLFGVLLQFPGSPLRLGIDSAFVRNLLGGLAMGLSAIAIIYSPWGKQSGAHINPSTTLTFLRLGKIKVWDALFYIAAQFVGSALAVAVVASLIPGIISHPSVHYVVTIPGAGVVTAFAAEAGISFLLITVVLNVSNNAKLSSYTGLFVGLMVAIYITLESPLSGMSMNPARTFGSAFSARVWTALWLYFTAPPLGMLGAAELYLWRNGRLAVKCCKYHHNNSKRCIFCGANGGFCA
jgi:aquaporin Z